jgi:hypothetical protein
VAQDEDALPPVRRTDLIRSQHRPFRIVPDTGQGPEYGVDPSNSEGSDVLQDDVSRFHLANDAGDVEEDARPLSSDACTCSGEGDVLAWESCTDDIDLTHERSAVEVGDVAAPHRARIQSLIFHPRQEHGRCVGIPLDTADQACSEHGTDGKVEPSDTAA